MTRAELIHLRYALRNLRASITGLEGAIPRARYPDLLQLELRRLKNSEAELVRRVDAERAAIDEPHEFIPNPRLPERLARWCFRCGGTRDRAELHPPELQVTNHEGAAQAAGGN